MADSLGYCSFPARGSRGIVDIVAFQSDGAYGTLHANATLVPLAIQVGTTAKAISKTLDELDVAPRPIGSLCIVARRHRHPKSKRISWTFHSRAGKFETLAALLDAR